MGKRFKFLSTIAICSLLIFSACSSKNTAKNLEGRVFEGYKGGQILVSGNVLHFSGAGVIKPNTKPEDLKDNEEKLEKSKLKKFKNPKIVEENGKKYLTADDFKYKLVVLEDNLIKDEEDGNEYVSIDKTKK